MAKNTSYVATSPILAKVLEENQRLVSPGKDEYGPQEEEKSKYHSLGMDDSPPRQSQGKTENVQSTESPGRNGPFDLKEFIAKLQTSPKKSGSPKKENSKSAGSALIQEKMDNDLENGGEPKETSTINQKEQWAITDGHHDADVQLKVLNPDKVVDSSNDDDMAWKADPHGFYQSSKNSNFTTLRFSDIDVSDVSEGEEKSDDGRFSKGESDEIADGDRLKYDESSNGRYKRDITEVDIPDLTDNANKTKGIPMVFIQAPTPSDVSRASSSVGSSRSETPETEAQKDVVSTTRRSSNTERSLSKDSVTEDDLSSCSEIEDDTIATRPCPSNEVLSTDFTVGEHGLSSLSKDTVTKDGLTSQPEKTDLIDGIFGEENKYVRIGDAKLSNNNISESVLEVNETNLDDKRTQIIRSDFQETDRSLDPDLHDDITALSDISADLDESFESADMANNSLMTSWSELEIVRAISQNEHSETVKFSKTVDSSPKITWGSTTTAHNDVSTMISDVETGNDILRTSIGSATELRAILERSDPMGADISSGSVVLGGHGSFDSDTDFSLAEEDVNAAEPADEDTQGEYILQECTRDEPTEKEHTEAISNWATQSPPETLERAEEGTGYKFKFRVAKEEEAAERIVNEFLLSFDEGDVLGVDGSDTNATPLMPVQTTEIQPTQKSMNVLFRKPEFDRIRETELGDINGDNGQDELLLTNETAAQKSVNELHSRLQFGIIPDTGSDDLDRENSPDELAKSPLPTNEIATGRLIDDRHGRPHYNRIIDTEPGDLDREKSPDELAKSPLPTKEIATGRLIDNQHGRTHHNRVIDTESGDRDRENSPDELAKSPLPTKEIATGRLIDNQHGRTHHNRVIDTEWGDRDREKCPDELAKSGLLTDETGTERLMKDRHGRPHYDKLLDNEPVGLDRENEQDGLTNTSSLRNETGTERSLNDRYTRSHNYRTPDNRSGNLDWENSPDYLSNVLEDLEAITLLKSVELERERLETVRGMRIKMEETFGGLPIEKIPACVYDKWQKLIGDIIGEQDMHFQGLEEEQESLIKGMRLEIENLTKEMFGLKKIAMDTESCKLENELLRKQLNGLEGYVSSLEGRIKCKTTENVSVMEELEDVRQEMTSKQREFKSYVNDSEQEITNLKSEIGCMKEERLKLLNEIKMKEIEYKKLVNEKEKVKDELQSDVGKINANSISLRNRIMELQQENETLKTANEADQTIIRHLEIKEGNLSDAMEELRKEKSKILKDLEESRIKEVDMRQEREVMNSEKNDFIKQNDGLKEKIRQIGVEKQSVTQELNSKMNTDLKNIEAMLQELKNLEASLNLVRKEKSLVEDKYNMLKYENERLHKMLHIKKRKHDVNKSDRNNHQRDTDLLIDLGPEINSRHGADTPQSINSVGQSSISDALDTYRSSNVSRCTDFIDAATLSTPREFKAPESSVTPLKATVCQNSFSGRKVAESQTPVIYREAQHLRASRETQPPGESIPSRDAITPSTNRRDVPQLYDSESESIDSYAPLPISSLGYSGPGYSGFSNGTPVPDVMVVRVESPTRKHANGTSQTQVKNSAAPDQRQSQKIVGNGKSNSYSAEDTRSWLRSMETKLEQTDQILKSMKKSNQVQV